MQKAPSFVSPLIVGGATAPTGAARQDAQLVRQNLSQPQPSEEQQFSERGGDPCRCKR